MSFCGNHPQSRKSTIRPTEDISRVQYCSPPSLPIGLSICMDLTAENTSENGSTHFNFHCINLSGLLLKMLKHEWPITLKVTSEVQPLVLVHAVPHSIESWSRSLIMRKCNHVMAVLPEYTTLPLPLQRLRTRTCTSKRTVNPTTSLPIRI
jgi:predicted amidohydrolase